MPYRPFYLQIHSFLSVEIYYFLVLIRCGDLVEASKIVSSDEALKNDLRMDFALGHRVTLNNLQPDFEAFLDIYCLVRSRFSIFIFMMKSNAIFFWIFC